MAYTSILTILSDIDDVATVLDQAAPFAAAHGAHLDVLCMGIDRTQTGYYFAGASAILHEETFAEAKERATAIEQAARERLGRYDLPWGVDAVVVPSPSVGQIAASHARFCDLVILPKPYGERLPGDAPVVAEAAMFQGQAPIIVLTDGAALSAQPKKIVAAWNDSSEALSAIRRALPLLTGAEEVSLCIVAPERHSEGAADPGSNMSTLLSRHGASVEINVLPQTLPRVSEVIARHVADEGADLLVMGAYGHSRLREAILGGATRNMLEHAKVPVFLAH